MESSGRMQHNLKEFSGMVPSQSADQVLSPVFTGRCACFVHDHGGELIEGGLEVIPNPSREILAGRVAQAIDLVQIKMVKPTDQWLGSFRDVPVVDQVPLCGVNVPLYDYIKTE